MSDEDSEDSIALEDIISTLLPKTKSTIKNRNVEYNQGLVDRNDNTFQANTMVMRIMIIDQYKIKKYNYFVREYIFCSNGYLYTYLYTFLNYFSLIINFFL